MATAACAECGGPIRRPRRKCAACRRETKGWQEAQWRARNRDHINAKGRLWASRHKADIRARRQRWHATPRGRELKRAAQARYLKTVRDKQNRQNREHYARKKARDPAWYAAQKKKQREVYGPAYRDRKKRGIRLRPPR